MMTLTDAAGDFLAYKVNLVSLQLMKSDGTLKIEASEKTTGRSIDVTIETPNVISGDELAKAKERSSAVRF